MAKLEDIEANVSKLKLKLDVDTEEVEKKLLEIEKIADRIAEKLNIIREFETELRKHDTDRRENCCSRSTSLISG